jgi:tRNA(fMet)-specific endonuclease VapC
MTGNNVVVDTSVAVHVLNGVQPFATWVPSFDAVFVPATVVGELLFGALNSQRASSNLPRYNQFVAACHVLDTTRHVAAEYASLRLMLKSRGRPIPENDIWIAATCIFHGLPLATTDAHFSQIPSPNVLRPQP